MKAQNNSTPRSSFVSECFPDDPHPASGLLLPSDGRRNIFVGRFSRGGARRLADPWLLSFALTGLQFVL